MTKSINPTPTPFSLIIRLRAACLRTVEENKYGTPSDCIRGGLCVDAAERNEARLEPAIRRAALFCAKNFEKADVWVGGARISDETGKLEFVRGAGLPLSPRALLELAEGGDKGPLLQQIRASEAAALERAFAVRICLDS